MAPRRVRRSKWDFVSSSRVSAASRSASVARRGSRGFPLATSSPTVSGLTPWGSAVVIHAGPDDHLAQPIGGSGARVACAELK